MAGSKDGHKDRLARYRQIKISVIGRKPGNTISIPVWFVQESKKLYLLPVQGSEMCSRTLQIPIDARGEEAELRAQHQSADSITIERKKTKPCECAPPR